MKELFYTIYGITIFLMSAAILFFAIQSLIDEIREGDFLTVIIFLLIILGCISLMILCLMMLIDIWVI